MSAPIPQKSKPAGPTYARCKRCGFVGRVASAGEEVSPAVLLGLVLMFVPFLHGLAGLFGGRHKQIYKCPNCEGTDLEILDEAGIRKYLGESGYRQYRQEMEETARKYNNPALIPIIILVAVVAIFVIFEISRVRP